MSYATLIIGISGTGKTCSLRNLDPNKTLLIQPVRKPLPFPSKGWKEITKDGGNIYVSPDVATIVEVMNRSKKEVIVIDDFQYILASMFMSRRCENGFQKFSDIGGAGYDICKTASNLAQDKRVYILGHSDTDELGHTKAKTLGKLLDDKIVLEGLFTTVLRTYVENSKYYFKTQNDGQDTTKSPMGMFEANLIDNDLAMVDKRICEYYGIGQEQTEQQEKPVESADTEPVDEPSKVDFETGVRVDELLQAISDAQTLDQLNALVEQLKSLNLPKDSDEYNRLGSAFKQKRHELTIDEELNYI